jgi:KaiC/GvpD/RAD55 family RecA-like ATPase
MVATPLANVQQPTLWVADILVGLNIPGSWNIRTFHEAREIPPGPHYILDDPSTPEWAIRYIGWQAPENCWVHRISTPVENLIGEAVSAQELSIQILEYALPFADWAKRKDSESICVKDTLDLAKVAIKHLKGSKLKAELAALRVRCGENSYDWNRLMASLEEEFKQELEKRGIVVDPISQDLDLKLKLDLLALLQESDPIKKIRKRAEICSYFRISKSEVEELLKYINRSTNQEELKSYTIDDLFDLESEGLTWVIPEMLPRGETIILAGSPKAGKSLLSIDAAFAIATGESQFLGEPVERGKVLLVSCDESLRSTKSKLIKRGFRRGDSIEVLPNWTIDKIHELQQKLEDYQPDVVIVDSLKRITHGLKISENSTDFADNIYTLKELFTKYNCSGILIHHTNKNKDAMGVDKLRGSSAIAGAVWGTWQLDHIPKPDPDNKKKLIIDPKDPVRVLSVFARDTEGQTLKIEFNPENNSWERMGVEEDATELSYRERILNILTKHSRCEGLSGRQIIELLGENGNKAIYNELNRMVNKRLISCKPSTTDKRINIYSLPNSHQILFNGGDSPSPIGIDSSYDYSSESFTTQGLEDSHKNSHQLVINSHQFEEQTNLMTNENPYPITVSLNSHQLCEIEGGEGVSETYVQVANVTENEVNTVDDKGEAISSNTALDAIATSNVPTPTTPAPEYKVGDTIRCYPTERHADNDWKVKATIHNIEYSQSSTGVFFPLFCEIRWMDKKDRIQADKIAGGLFDEWVFGKVR